MLLSEIAPLLSRSLTEAETPRAEASVAAMWGILSARYGRRLECMPVGQFEGFMAAARATVAAALERRLAKKNQQAVQESAGPFSVRWHDASVKGGWFLPEELAELDGAAGVRGTRSYRTPAPAAVRRANRMRGFHDW